MTVFYDTVWWDLIYRPIRWTSASEKLLSVSHHSKNSNFYLDFGPDSNYLYICRRDTPQLSFKLPSNGLAEFIRNQPKDYLDGERLSCSITTAEYLIDYTTGDTIHRFHSGTDLQELCLDLDTASLLCVKRVDHELASYSLKTGELLWYLRFSDFRARRVCGCGGVIHSDCYLYLDICGTDHQPGGRLAFTFLNHEFYIDDESRFLHLDNVFCFQEKDEDDDTKVPTKKKKKKKTQKTIKSTTAKQKELNETENNLISQCDGDKDVETEVQISEVPDPNYNHVGFHFVKLDSRYLVSKRCVCSLHDLMALVNNGPGQAKLPANVIKAMEFFQEPYNWVKLTRDIAEELAKLHKSGNVHGDLKPHNVYIDIDNNAIIPKDLNAYMSSSSEDADSSHSKAKDCYDMGRIILFIASNGKHEFRDPSKIDMNNSKDREDLELIKDEPEAYDIASRLLHHEPLSRPTAEQVYSHCLHWDPERCRSYLQDASDQLGLLWDDPDKYATALKLAEDLARIKNNVFHGTWCSKINKRLLNEKNRFRRNMGFHEYDGTSMCDFLLFIRNVCHHYPKSLNGDRDSFLTSIRSINPKLLMEVYKVFDDGQHDWTGTILYKYHMKS